MKISTNFIHKLEERGIIITEDDEFILINCERLGLKVPAGSKIEKYRIDKKDNRVKYYLTDCQGYKEVCWGDGDREIKDHKKTVLDQLKSGQYEIAITLLLHMFEN